MTNDQPSATLRLKCPMPYALCPMPYALFFNSHVDDANIENVFFAFKF